MKHFHIILILGLVGGFWLSNVSFSVKHNEAAHTGSGSLTAQIKKPLPKSEATLTSISTEPQPQALASTPAPVVTGCEQYRSLINSYDWEDSIAFAVMKAENTSCNPVIDNAGLNYNGSVDYGLFQVNSVHSAKVGGNLESLRDPSVNIATAYQIWRGSGWNAWSTYKAGKHLAFL